MTSRSMGEIISTLRKEKGMTQKEIADRLGITDKAVSKWETAKGLPDISLQHGRPLAAPTVKTGTHFRVCRLLLY